MTGTALCSFVFSVRLFSVTGIHGRQISQVTFCYIFFGYLGHSLLFLFICSFFFSFFLWYILINWLITQLTSIAISHRIIESEGISTLLLNFSSLSLFRSMPILPVVGTFLQLLVQTSAKCFDAGKQIFGYQYAPNTDDLAHITNQLVC